LSLGGAPAAPAAARPAPRSGFGRVVAIRAAFRSVSRFLAAVAGVGPNRNSSRIRGPLARQSHRIIFGSFMLRVPTHRPGSESTRERYTEAARATPELPSPFDFRSRFVCRVASVYDARGPRSG
jgi:hypothetical protein